MLSIPCRTEFLIWGGEPTLAANSRPALPGNGARPKADGVGTFLPVAG